MALGRTVAELEHQLSARELREWEAYAKLEPFGPWRDNLHSATIAHIVANANRDPKRRPRPYTIQDFFYIDPESRRAQIEAQTLAFFRSKVKDA